MTVKTWPAEVPAAEAGTVARMRTAVPAAARTGAQLPPVEWVALRYPRWSVALWIAALGGAALADMVSRSLVVVLVSFAVVACLGPAAFAVARRTRLILRSPQDREAL